MKQATFTPTGIEAQVCEDIARRQQLGIHKYGRTVAENPLALKSWMQHRYEELLDAAVYVKRAMAELPGIMAAPPAEPAPKRKVRRDCQYTLHGERVSIQQLADKAGCSWSCMQSRLKHHEPEVAVAMGAPDQRRRAAIDAMMAARRAAEKRHAYGDQMLSSAELATLAGCSTKVMGNRLMRMSAAEAVAIGSRGATGPKGPYKAPPATADQAQRLTTPKNKPAMPLKRVENFARDAEIIVPPNVKRTVAPAPQERFAISSAPSHFAGRRPGQYDEDAAETALARAGVARGAA